METKLLTFDQTELKFTEGRLFSGYASTFNNVDAFGDTILPGAYAETVKNRVRPIRMRWNHFGPVIGKWVKMEEDSKGLYVEGELTPGHTTAENVHASLKHGAVDGLSIGFRIPPGGSAKDGKIRQLKKIDLVEVSVVEEPADLAARIGDVKAAINEIQDLKTAEALLRDGFGLSWATAKALVSQIKALALRDGDAEAKPEQIRALFQRYRLA